ncbi:MAG TPA: ParB/RepB/Spo0J family partition protein [Anaerolineales bacterium]|nr:ParB/RepB/Spo0J family partition protein [Anaerolineales bacterium]
MNIAIMKIDQLSPNPYQTREREDPDQVVEVAGSILKVGLLQVPVGRRADGKGVQLAFGHTRLAAYRKLVADGHREFEQMPVDVRELSDQEMFELAIRENLERKELTPIEEARAMATYRDQFGKTSEEIGELFHLSASAVRNKVRLLELPAAVQGQVGAQITEGTARKLLTLQKLAPQRVEGMAIKLTAGGYESAEEITAWIGDVLGEESFRMVARWQASKSTDEDSDKIRAGEGLWRLDWKATVDPPSPTALLKMLPERLAIRLKKSDLKNAGPDQALSEIIFALASGTDPVGIDTLWGIGEDTATWIRQLVAPPPCSACEFHQVLDGSHYCGIKVCWTQKRRAWIAAETRRLSKKLGIPIYDPAADGKAHISAPIEYVNADEPYRMEERLHSTWQKLLDAKDASLRLRGKTPGYRKGPGTGSHVVELIRVGKPAEKALAADKKRVGSPRYDYEAQRKKQDREWALQRAAQNFVRQQAGPILAEALVNSESIAGLEMIHDALRDDEGRSKAGVSKDKAARLATLRARIASAVLISALDFRDARKGPQAVAKHLAGVAKTLGARLPKDWDEIAAGYEPASTETETAEDDE